jgi:hypothetical protein
VGSLRDCTWILGLSQYRVVELKHQDERLAIAIEHRGIWSCLFGMWPEDESGSRSEGASLGRPAVGGASSHASVSVATGLVPAQWHPNRARGLCRAACAVDTAFSATDRARLSIDAHQSRGSAACRQLGGGAARGTGLSQEVGSPPAEAPTATSGCG